MANIPEEIVDGSVTQLTRSISEGVRVYVPRGDRFISQVVRGVMANGGMGSGFITVGVNEFLEASGGMRANSVSGIVSQSVVNGVGTNGDGKLVPKGMRVNGVSREGRESVVNVTTEILAVKELEFALHQIGIQSQGYRELGDLCIHSLFKRLISSGYQSSKSGSLKIDLFIRSLVLSTSTNLVSTINSTKHIEIDIHFVHDMVVVGLVRVLYVPSRYEYADIFTKGLPSAFFEEFRTSLRVWYPPVEYICGGGVTLRIGLVGGVLDDDLVKGTSGVIVVITSVVIVVVVGMID
ncbi:hypothetical protein Tco_0771470 [Tanacetum coccineum]|uniref:Uncharacterized protein n=1 Tax=Tanacetum coccineum TaxID=301880 RepID=A0ABQ4ZF59_9ASTR